MTYQRGKFMHWITILGIIFIAAGTILTYVGQSISSKSDVACLQLSIGEKNGQIEDLVKGKNELIAKIDQYQKIVTEKDAKIDQLKSEVSKLNLTSPKLLPDGRIAGGNGCSFSSEYSDASSRARKLFTEEKYDEAYSVANDLMNKIPDFGLAYFLMGTIETERNNIAQGEKYLEKAIQLELTNDDKAWALHNLGIIAQRQQNIIKAIDYLKMAIQTNPQMEESRKALKLIEDQSGTMQLNNAGATNFITVQGLSPFANIYKK